MGIAAVGRHRRHHPRLLSADPVEEVKVGFDILKSLGLRHRGVNIIACPSCARQGFNVIKTVEALEERLAHISTPMSLSIIGCVVNGPGEALMTDIGFTGGGNGTHRSMSPASRPPDEGRRMVDHIVELVEKKAAEIEAAKAAEADRHRAPRSSGQACRLRSFETISPGRFS